MYTRPIERLQIDFTTSCNARCLFCSRQDFFGKDNTHLPKSRTLSLSILQKALNDPLLANVKEIFFCGNYGDALASPKIEDHLNWLAESRPNVRWNIHTNGSLGTLEFWERMGKLSALKKGLVKFSIDGLADTNHLYRREVEFDRVLRNLRQFINSGGRAVWKFIEFAHNKHQIESAKALALDLGCYRFELRKNYSPNEESYLFEQPKSPPTNESLADKFSQQKILTADRKISCRALNDNSLYLDFDGLIWPCCWMHDWKYSPTQTKREWHRRHFFPLETENFNSLDHFTLTEILQHSWFKNTLPGSWGGMNESLHPTCNSTCSVALSGTTYDGESTS